MIEIYLAVLLFGLGTYFNKKDVFTKTPEGKLNVQPGIDINTIDAVTAPVSTEQPSDTIKRLEAEYGKNLDDKCREIQRRDFSSLLDEKSRELYKSRKLGETGKLKEIDNELHDGVFKYQGKKKNAVYSNLTGTDIPLAQFTNSQVIGKEGAVGSDKINNTWAVPYFGSVAKQNMNVEGFQNKLENFTGNSQFNFHKKETKNFFVPNKDVAFVNGSPIQTSTLQERFNRSNNRTNELPFERVRVGPGVGQNYGTDGKGGFHQFESGEVARPKTVDDLRVLSNPKVTYTPPTVSGKAVSDKRSATPNLVRNKTSKTFAQSHSDLLKTTGAFLREKANENFIIKDTNRTESKSIFGSAAPVSDKRTYTKPHVEKSRRNIYSSSGVNNTYRANSWNANSKNSDYGKSTIVLPPNERDVTQKRTHVTNIMSLVKSIIAPLQDKLRGTRKDFIKGNPNPEGYMGANIPEKPTMYDPDDIARTTIKETTLEYDHDGHISGPNKIQVHDPNDVARTTVKETTLEYDHDGNIGGPQKLTVYDPNDIARTTIKETTIHSKQHTVVTGAKKVSVYDPNEIAKTTIKETTEVNKHSGNIKEQVPSRPTDYNMDVAKTTIKETTERNKHTTNVSFVRGDGKGYLSNDFFAPATLKQLTSDNEYGGNIYSSQFSSGGYLSNEFYAPATLKQFTSEFEYTGTANSSNKAAQSYQSMYNAITNSLREKTLRGRAPTKEGAKRFNARETINVSFNKQNASIPVQKTLRISRVNQINTDARSENVTTFRTPLSNKQQVDRFNPAQLNMLRKNPYAISLNRNFGASPNAGTGAFSDSDGE